MNHLKAKKFESNVAWSNLRKEIIASGAAVMGFCTHQTHLKAMILREEMFNEPHSDNEPFGDY